jgi:hypothetical protein
MSIPTKTNNKTRFLLLPNLYSTCNYQSPHGLILSVSIKARLGNLSNATFFILGASIKAHLGDLGSATINRLNYLGMSICH